MFGCRIQLLYSRYNKTHVHKDYRIKTLQIKNLYGNLKRSVQLLNGSSFNPTNVWHYAIHRA